MIKDLNNIFNAITPDNIKDIPLIKDAMSIFIETLEELAKESIDIQKIYENESIKEELFKIYLNDLFNVFKRVENNQQIIDSIVEYNKRAVEYGSADLIPDDIITNISSFIKEEHFLTFKSFKQTKGTLISIQYIYELINSLMGGRNGDLTFTLREEGPFNISMSGPLPKEFYDHLIHPLAHPLGFVYAYDRMLQLILEDYFSVDLSKFTIGYLAVVCFNPETDENDIEIYIDENNPRKVIDRKEYTENDISYKEFHFEDGNYLKQTTQRNGSSSVTYFDEYDDIIKEYTGQCAIAVGKISYELDGRLKDDQDEHTKQYQTVPDFFARLNPSNNSLKNYEMGTNNLLDSDGNYGGTREEHFYAPSFESQLKYLQGKYQENVEVEVDGVTYIQPIKYTDVIDEALKIIDSNVSVAKFEEQNVGNEDHIARELLVEKRHVMMFQGETYKEPVWVATENFIDANGNDRGSFGAYAGYVGSDPITIPRLSEMGTLVGSDTTSGDFYGRSVAQYGNKLAVGAIGWDSSTKTDVGKVYVFEKTDAGFVEIGSLTAPDQDFYDKFGTSVAIFENRLLVGATGEDTAGDRAGKVYYYDWNSSFFEYVGEIVSPDPSAVDYFGISVSVFENRLVISATLDDAATTNAGRVFIYDWDGSDYNFVSALTAPDAYLNDRFGSAVSLSNDTLIIGAEGKWKSNYNDWGKVYVYKWDGSNYIAHSEIEPSDATYGKRFGFSASLFGDVLVVGAPFDTVDYSGDGSIYTFKWNGSIFEEMDKITASDGFQNEYFGNAVSLYEDSLIVGAYNDNNTTGTAYIFDVLEETVDEPGRFTTNVVSDEFMVGGYWQDYDWFEDNFDGAVHTISDSVVLDTSVNADPVNLQYNTKEFGTSILQDNPYDIWEKEEPTVTFITDDFGKEFWQSDEFDESFIKANDVENWEKIEQKITSTSEYTSDDFLMNESESTVYRFDMNNITTYQSVINFDTIGSGYVIGTGLINTDAGETATGSFEIYNNFNYDADDDFEFGVYRDGVLLEDNNIGAMS